MMEGTPCQLLYGTLPKLCGRMTQQQTTYDEEREDVHAQDTHIIHIVYTYITPYVPMSSLV